MAVWFIVKRRVALAGAVRFPSAGHQDTAEHAFMMFSEEHSHRVRLHHRELGDLGEATLTFGGETSVIADMGLFTVSPKLRSARSLDFVGAKTANGHTFTLCHCTIHESVIYATYLVCGDITEDCFKRIEVRYSDISEWFLNRQHVDGKVGEQITWVRLVPHFSVEVTERGRQFTVSSQYHGSRNHIGEDYIVHEHVEFFFETHDGGFHLEDVRRKTLDLAALLSLLINYPISVISVDVLTKSDRLYAAYFGTFEQFERDKSRNFLHQCFLQKHILDGRWALILQKYFASDGLKELWVRLAGMLRYEGFWEYRLLAYVSLLDKYVNWHARTAAVPNKWDELQSEVVKIAPQLEATVVKAIVKAAKSLLSHPSPFGRKYDFAIRQTDIDVLKIISISDAEFKLIKAVRDRIAHGEDPDVSEDDFPRVHNVVSKIALLLTFWTFLDLGLERADFLQALSSTHNKLRFSAPLDEMHLDRVTGTATFYNVTPEKFKLLASLDRDFNAFPCLVEGESGEIQPSRHYSTILRDWHMNPSRQQGMFRLEEIFGVEKGAVRHASLVYIESGSDTLRLFSVYIFYESKLQNPTQAR